MLTMWPCKWNCDEEKWNMLSNGGWKTLAFSAAQSNLDFGAVFATLVFPWDAVLLCHLSLSLCVRDSSFFCSLARRQPGGSSRAMGLSFQGKGTRPGSCFSFSFLVEFWGFCCETLMVVRCRKTDSFLSFFLSFFLAEFWFDPDGAFWFAVKCVCVCVYVFGRESICRRFWDKRRILVWGLGKLGDLLELMNEWIARMGSRCFLDFGFCFSRWMMMVWVLQQIRSS
jgi:hypothetical protein